MQTPPAEPGMAVEEVDTPALLVDLDALDRNLRRMAEAARAAGVALRPHAKMHKSPDLARLQMAHGAAGVCCQKVGEAEAMVAGGVADVLVSNEVVGARKLARLAALARVARVGVCVDDAENVAQLSAAATAAGVELAVLVELDVNGARCGVLPGAPARALAAAVDRAPGLRLAGIQAYHGRAQHLRTWEERRAAIAAATDACRETMAAFAAAGLPCAVVTGAGTGTFEFEAASGVYTELQCGSYAFMDVDYGRNLDRSGQPVAAFEQALFVWSTVMSVPARDRAVCDAGLKAIAFDSGPPLVAGRDGLDYAGPSDEHGTLRVAPTNRPPVLGEKIRLVPGHCDPTVNLHDWLVGVRAGRVETVWPVTARGAMA
ncbi:MAG: DSD1 family PLP-dependent enzyme [Alphaproteobacteria bacterium]